MDEYLLFAYCFRENQVYKYLGRSNSANTLIFDEIPKLHYDAYIIYKKVERHNAPFTFMFELERSIGDVVPLKRCYTNSYFSFFFN